MRVYGERDSFEELAVQSHESLASLSSAEQVGKEEMLGRAPYNIEGSQLWVLQACEFGGDLCPLSPDILNWKRDPHFAIHGVISWCHLPSEIYAEGPTRWRGG